VPTLALYWQHFSTFKAILDAERQAMEQDAVETVSAKPVMAK